MGPVNLKMFERRLKALANVRRLRIVQLLKRRRSVPVGAIAKTIGLSLTATSKHLAILAANNIVKTRKRGLEVYYRLSLHQKPPVKHILSLL